MGMQFIFIMIGLNVSSAAHLIHVKSYEIITIYTHQVTTDKEVLYTIENTSF